MISVRPFFQPPGTLRSLGSQPVAVLIQVDQRVLSPVNHYWSLSVEEQFYLVWPALLYFSLRIAIARTRRTAESLIPVVIGVLMATILALSLISAILAIHHSPSAAYFLTYARAWEFAAGGLAGLMLGKLKNRLQAGWIMPLFGAAWLTLIASSWFLRPESGIPGLAAVPVVLAAAIILVIGDDHASPLARRIIGFHPCSGSATSPIRFTSGIGRCYSHTFRAGSREAGSRPADGPARISLALSGITKRHVEDRFRSPRPDKSKRRGLWAMRLLSPHIC